MNVMMGSTISRGCERAADRSDGGAGPPRRGSGTHVLGEGSWPARRRRFALHFAGADAALPSSPAVGCCGHGARQRKVSFAGEAQEPA